MAPDQLCTSSLLSLGTSFTSIWSLCLAFCLFSILLVCLCAKEPNLPLGFASSESTLQEILTGIVGRIPKAPLPNAMRGKLLQLH